MSSSPVVRVLRPSTCCRWIGSRMIVARKAMKLRHIVPKAAVYPP